MLKQGQHQLHLRDAKPKRILHQQRFPVRNASKLEKMSISLSGGAAPVPNRGCYATASCPGLITLPASFPARLPSQQSPPNEASPCSWLCLGRLNAGFPCSCVTVTAVTRCPLQPGCSEGWRAMDSAGKSRAALKWRGATATEPGSDDQPSEMLNHQCYRSSQTLPGSHLSLCPNTFITAHCCLQLWGQGA